jgi:hypothetical protein
MEQHKVRIVNQKTGEAKFVMPHIADNAKLLKSYGFIKQDFKKEEKKPIGEVVVSEDGITFIPDTPGKSKDLIGVPQDSFETSRKYVITDNTVTEANAREKYFEIFGKKAGNKSLATMLKEIEDKQTK